MPKILMLSPYYYPEQVSSSHMSNDLNEALFKNGYTIENFVPTPCRGINDDIRNEYKSKKLEIRDNGHSIVHRFDMVKERKNPVLRAIRYLLVNIVQYRKGIKTDDVALVYAGSTPPTQGLLCSKVKKSLSNRYGHTVPFVYNLQDIFPDSLVNAKLTKEGSLIWKIGRKIENYTYSNADKIIVISEDFKKNISEKGVSEDKIIVIPNWVNTDNVIPIDRKDNILIERYGIDPNSFIVCYSGNIGHSQNLLLLVDLAKRVKDKYHDVLFVVIGEGAQKEELIKLKEENNLSNILVLPFQDYSEIASVFSLGDAGLLISKKGTGLTSVPSKTWGIMAASRPVLGSIDEESYASKLINNIGCGLTADADDIDSLEKALIQMYEDRGICTEMGVKGRKYVTTELNKNNATQKYIEVIKSVIS